MRMKPFGKLISRLTAMRLIEENIKPISRTENVKLEYASGRVLATDVVAEFNVPSFDRAAMDGYAVKAKDTIGASKEKPVILKIIGEQHAGELYTSEIRSGECIEIATGSPIPKGTDAVVMVEFTSLDENNVLIYKETGHVDNIAPEGEDIKIGDLVVEKSTLLSPSKIGAIAALGFKEIEVFAKPRVAIYSSGLEIVPQGQPLKQGQIYDVNSFTLASVIRDNGCIPFQRGIMKDTVESIEASLLDASCHDLGVFSGGSSVGSKDLFGEVVELRGEIYFHGVKVKPGKPTLFGKIGEVPIFGMPGYPTSCLSNSYVFLIPAIRKLSRLPPKELKRVTVPMGHYMRSRSEREQFITVKIKDGKAFRVFKKSGDITSMSNAEGYIVLPVSKDSVKKDEEVTVTLFDLR
jgi:molybdenum cofactor synthesis domain-containing protein